ncbi:hypothetical protein INR49_005735 [Caranx melampygus]|nr:hypothetical protein INR49_005735 [Caranx melampygus]
MNNLKNLELQEPLNQTNQKVMQSERKKKQRDTRAQRKDRNLNHTNLINQPEQTQSSSIRDMETLVLWSLCCGHSAVVTLQSAVVTLLWSLCCGHPAECCGHPAVVTLQSAVVTLQGCCSWCRFNVFAESVSHWLTPPSTLQPLVPAHPTDSFTFTSPHGPAAASPAPSPPPHRLMYWTSRGSLEGLPPTCRAEGRSAGEQMV